MGKSDKRQQQQQPGDGGESYIQKGLAMWHGIGLSLYPYKYHVWCPPQCTAALAFRYRVAGRPAIIVETIDNWLLTFAIPFISVCLSLSVTNGQIYSPNTFDCWLSSKDGDQTDTTTTTTPKKLEEEKNRKSWSSSLEIWSCCFLYPSIHPCIHPSQLFGKGFTGYSIMFYCSYRLAPKVDQIQHPPRWSLFSSGLLCLIHTHSHTHVRHGPLCVYRGNRKVDASTGILRLWSVTRPYRPCLNQNQISTQQVKKNIGRNCVGQKKNEKRKRKKKGHWNRFSSTPPPLILPGPDRVSKVEDEKVTRQS
jgi:hypothetical protein